MKGNRVELKFSDGRIACWFYGVPLAAFIPRDIDTKIISDDPKITKIIGKLKGSWVCTSVRYSAPYTQQMNKWANPTRRIEVSDYILRKIISPIERAK